MENYIVSARKYRPSTFDTVVGQESLTTTLKNAIHSGHLAHAYLFCGPRGVGKTTCARIFAKTINCLNPTANGEACNECESCKAFNEQRSYNIHELDAASNNSVDDIRQLIEQVRIPPQIGKYKVFIIDEVHMLSTAAFNAFLKTLEEPPHHAIFILATTEKHKLLPTILSRCQIYDFNRMSVRNIVAHLRHVAQNEGIEAEEEALGVIAQKADGGMRDALSIFDQVASFCRGNITYSSTIANLNVLDYDYYFKLTDYFLGGKITDIMLTLDEILGKGFDGQHFITGLASHLRDLLVSRDAQTVSLLETAEDVKKRYAEQAQRCSPKFLYAAMKLCNNCDLAYKQSHNKRLLVELTLIEVAQLSQGEEVPSSGLCPTKKLKPIFADVAAQPQSATVKHQQPAGAGSDKPNVTASNEAGVNVQAQQEMPVRQPKLAPAAPKATATRRDTGFSIRKTMESVIQSSSADSGVKPAEVQAVRQQPAVAADKPFDNNELRIAWREFASSLPQDDIAMATRMNNIDPELLPGGYSFEVLADNPTVEGQLQRFVPGIEQYLRRRLSNKSVKMLVRQRKVEEKRRAYNRLEQFTMMCEMNPALLKLKEEFGLELGG
ncbi:MAG: DNA polymerase III subunit gamma/tau [Bacteroides sp.]|nr:DNA polymerase III subunit gamma/tau [Roseburia sp.]MCM1346694.1 DNA polymerase III subunit gamma/tau [Bacteroides sp.]MCM1419946.1 DNA polymerase III subunit gamma/tau [Bacteroides sp.]